VARDESLTKPDQRRSRRFPVVVPVEVKWQEPSGKVFREAAQAREVNAHGGLLDMKIYPWVGGDLELTNLISGQSTHARVVGTARSKEGAFLGVAVALVVPDETFWGVNFQLRKTSADLANIGQAIGFGVVDLRALRESSARQWITYAKPRGWFRSGRSANCKSTIRRPHSCWSLLSAFAAPPSSTTQ
jgi:hypothetical protein